MAVIGKRFLGLSVVPLHQEEFVYSSSSPKQNMINPCYFLYAIKMLPLVQEVTNHNNTFASPNGSHVSLSLQRNLYPFSWVN